MTQEPPDERKAATMGRPLGKTGKATQQAMESFLARTDGEFSTNDVRQATMQSVVTVRNRLNSLINAGEIKKVRSVHVIKNGVSARGRPQCVYRKVPRHE